MLRSEAIPAAVNSASRNGVIEHAFDKFKWAIFARMSTRQIAAGGARTFATNQGDDPPLTPYSSTECIIIARETPWLTQ